MNRAVKSEAKLRELLAHGALPASACGNALRQLTAPLVAGGVLTWIRSGTGKKLVVTDHSRFNEFVAATYPYSANEIDLLESARVSAVARYRDSKSLPNDLPEIINLRAWTDEGLRWDGKPVRGIANTMQYGIFSFSLEDSSQYTLHTSCALVENPALFRAFERLALPIKIVFLGRGRISERLLDWFGNQVAADFSLLHLPDYDPVGLNEFERLRMRLGSRVRLYAPDDLQQRFTRFGNTKLLSKSMSRTMLANLRSSKIEEVLRIVALIDEYNAGLEQEALLL
jgi:hypothetical protein